MQTGLGESSIWYLTALCPIQVAGRSVRALLSIEVAPLNFIIEAYEIGLQAVYPALIILVEHSFRVFNMVVKFLEANPFEIICRMTVLDVMSQHTGRGFLAPDVSAVYHH